MIVVSDYLDVVEIFLPPIYFLITQNRNVWLSLVAMLEKKEKLPVVAFTFSRKKCDENADSLSNLNLTSKSEKSRTQVLLQKYLAKLKGSDRTLPQVR